MEDLKVDLIFFLGALEAVIVFMVIAAVFVIRGRVLSSRVKNLQEALKKAAAVEIPEPVTYEQYLRDEVIRNQDLLEKAAASDDDAEKKAAELLKMRKQFLQLELDARAVEKNPVEFQDRIAAGLCELIEQLRPEPETVTADVTEDVIKETPEEQEAGAGQAVEQRRQIDTHQAEFERLRQVINNQQDAMARLREELKAREAEIQDLDSIMAKLDEFERHDTELQRCLALLEKENQRLKQGGKGSIEVTPMQSGRLAGLQDMLSGQQETIANLQHMVQELAPEASKAKELQDALGSMERANMELNSCVAVLEDENAMLRAELEAVAQQLEAQEAEREAAAAVEIADEPSGGDSDEEILAIDEEPALVSLEEAEEDSQEDELQKMEVKLQELEALVEFKDAAIEELEKQYSILESKYLAATGEKKVD